MRRYSLTFLVLILLVLAPMATAVADAEKGKVHYDKYCSQCHGDTGAGDGWATPRVKPVPRDFTSGKYKFRSTPSGKLPTDQDVIRIIREGVPYTSMPGWPIFSESDMQDIVDYLKTFSADFENPEMLGDPIDIPEPPASSEESVARGTEIYVEQGCGACHGLAGRGDGMSGPTLRDDWGNHLRAADMTMRWTFRGGPTRQDIFRTFSTGLNGTPMPSYYDSLKPEDRWHLVNYIYSLGQADTPNYANLLKVAYVEEEIDVNEPGTIFDVAEVGRFPLVGQIMEPGRNFYPSTTSVRVQAVYNRSEIGFRLQWNDMRAETDGSNDPAAEVPLWDEEQPARGSGGGGEEDDFWGDEEDPWAEEEPEESEDDWGEEGEDFWGEDEGGDAAAGGEFSDAVAIQFPTQMPTGIRKPYFIYGDSQNAVDLWFVDLARGDRLQQFVGRGSDSLERSEADEFEVSSSFDQGQWTVVVKRELKARGGISMASEQFVPVGFSVWDAFNRERGNKRALSPWFYLYLQPTEVASPVGPMVRAGLIALFVELLAVFIIRRRFAMRATAAQGEPLPAGSRS